MAKEKRRQATPMKGDIPLPPMDSKPKPSLLAPYRRLTSTIAAGRKKLK